MGASIPLTLFLILPFLALVLTVHPKQWLASITQPMAVSAFELTLETSSIATFICIVFGTPIALLLGNHKFRGRDILAIIVNFPMAIPPVVSGVCLLLAFGRMGLLGSHLHAVGIDLSFSTAAVVMAQVMMAAPFFIKTAMTGIETVDPSLEEAAKVCGASQWRIFWSVTLPLARPALVTGTLLAWGRALSEFGATMMFAGNFQGKTQTLPLAVMSAFDTDLDGAVAISTIALILSALVLGATRLLTKRWDTYGNSPIG